MGLFDLYECDKYEECLSETAGKGFLCSNMYVCQRWKEFLPYRECLRCEREYKDYPKCIVTCDDDREENFYQMEGYLASDDTNLEDY